MRISLLSIRICICIRIRIALLLQLLDAVIIAYEIIDVFHYYLNLYTRLIMWLLLYASLNKLIFHLLHNSRLSAIKDYCFIE
jgi:hypothetical protein